MKKILVLGASVVLALAPSGTALAGEPTNSGLGNCGYSAAGGNADAAGEWGLAGAGFGGRMTGGSYAACERVRVQPGGGPKRAVVIGDDLGTS